MKHIQVLLNLNFYLHKIQQHIDNYFTHLYYFLYRIYTLFKRQHSTHIKHKENHILYNLIIQDYIHNTHIYKNKLEDYFLYHVNMFYKYLYQHYKYYIICYNFNKQVHLYQQIHLNNHIKEGLFQMHLNIKYNQQRCLHILNIYYDIIHKLMHHYQNTHHHIYNSVKILFYKYYCLLHQLLHTLYKHHNLNKYYTKYYIFSILSQPRYHNIQARNHMLVHYYF